MRRVRPSPANSNVNGEQLAMFMTPREIMGKYQPLDGDRNDRGTAAWDDRSNEYTNRSRNTRGDTNYPLRSGIARAHPHAQGRTHMYNPGEETDDQLWDRKLSESMMSKGDYDLAVRGEFQEPEQSGGDDRSDFPRWETGHTRTFGSRMDSWQGHRDSSYDRKVADYYEGESLHESIAREGVQHPIRLGSETGSSGKPQVVGGHHRLAAANSINDQQLLPVLHDQNLMSARVLSKRARSGEGGYEYR